MRQDARVLRQPVPVDTIEHLTRQLLDLGVPEVLAAGEDPAEQNCAVDGGDFGIPEAVAGVDVGPVVEEAAMVRHLFPKKAQPGEDPAARFIIRDPPALLADAECREAEAGRRDAAEVALVGDAHVESIADDASLGAALFQEKQK